MENKKSQVWGSRLSAAPDKLNIEFCAGRDVKSIPMADEVLLPYDVWTNLAHARMLHKSGILTKDELKDLRSGLNDLINDYEKGRFTFDPQKEDVHINVEHYITHHKGIEAGKKIHTGRSRNDQVTTDMRLYIRDQLLALGGNIGTLSQCILEKANSEIESIMPGFTHYQPAMIITAAHWLTGWSQALLRDIKRILNNIELINLSPLGSAAAFGTSWPINREFSAELLGFSAVDQNTLDCITSRGESEADIASSVSILMNHLGTISQDIILLSTPYYKMIRLDDRFVTGSSIMPQKRNPDFAEVIRSKASFSQGILISLLSTLKGSMSGYNRDSQQTKYLIMDLFREVLPAPVVLSAVCESMEFDRDNMLAQSKIGFMNSADVADWMAQNNELSFRECYEVLSLAVKYSEEEGTLTKSALDRAIKEQNVDMVISENDVEFLNDPASILKRKTHTGAPSPDAVNRMLKSQEDQLSILLSELDTIKNSIEKARRKCFENA